MSRKTLLVLLVALSTHAKATDIHVGPSFEVSDIATASALANDGDRILVEPGDYYGFAINKSVTILPGQEGVAYTVTGTVDIGAANGKEIFISGMKALNGVLNDGAQVLASATLSQLTKLTIADSDLKVVAFTAQPLLRVELFRNTIQVRVEAQSFAIFGCRIFGTGTWYEVALLGNSTALPQDNYLIGCMLGYPITSAGGFPALVGLMVQNINRPIHFENNIVYALNCAISITGGTSSDVPSSVLNNTHFGPVYAGNSYVPSLIGHIGLGNPPATGTNHIVRNNARVGLGTTTVEPIGLNGTPQYMIESNNLAVPLAQLDLNSGVPLSSSALIDGGHPDPRYLDLDLTTNDVGCYGGSNSRANFTTPMGSAVVGFLQAPRVVSQGEDVNITTTGFDR